MVVVVLLRGFEGDCCSCIELVVVVIYTRLRFLLSLWVLMLLKRSWGCVWRECC